MITIFPVLSISTRAICTPAAATALTALVTSCCRNVDGARAIVRKPAYRPLRISLSWAALSQAAASGLFLCGRRSCRRASGARSLGDGGRCRRCPCAALLDLLFEFGLKATQCLQVSRALFLSPPVTRKHRPGRGGLNWDGHALIELLELLFDHAGNISHEFLAPLRRSAIGRGWGLGRSGLQ